MFIAPPQPRRRRAAPLYRDSRWRRGLTHRAPKGGRPSGREPGRNRQARRLRQGDTRRVHAPGPHAPRDEGGGHPRRRLGGGPGLQVLRRSRQGRLARVPWRHERRPQPHQTGHARRPARGRRPAQRLRRRRGRRTRHDGRRRRERLGHGGLRARRDAWVAVEDDEGLVGYAYTGDQFRTGELEADLWVHPEQHEPELATRLLGLVERRSRELAAERGYEAPMLDIFCIGVNRAKRELLLRHGYALSRTVYRMAADLSDGVAALPAPEGIVVRPFRLEVDERVMHA